MDATGVEVYQLKWTSNRRDVFQCDRTQCDERENAGNGDDIHHHSVLSGSNSTGVRLMCGECAMDGQDWLGGCDEWRDVEMCNCADHDNTRSGSKHLRTHPRNVASQMATHRRNGDMMQQCWRVDSVHARQCWHTVEAGCWQCKCVMTLYLILICCLSVYFFLNAYLNVTTDIVAVRFWVSCDLCCAVRFLLFGMMRLCPGSLQLTHQSWHWCDSCAWLKVSQEKSVARWTRTCTHNFTLTTMSIRAVHLSYLACVFRSTWSSTRITIWPQSLSHCPSECLVSCFSPSVVAGPHEKTLPRFGTSFSLVSSLISLDTDATRVRWLSATVPTNVQGTRLREPHVFGGKETTLQVWYFECRATSRAAATGISTWWQQSRIQHKKRCTRHAVRPSSPVWSF